MRSPGDSIERREVSSSNCFDCLISTRVTGGLSRRANSRSTTANFGFFGSSRGSDPTSATLTALGTPPL